jgi:hypothetical protein
VFLGDADGVPGDGLNVLRLNGRSLGGRHAADGALIRARFAPSSGSLFIVVLFNEFLLVRLAFNVFAKGPGEVPAEAIDQCRVALAALGNEVEQTGDKHTDERKPPAKRDNPENVAREQMALGLGRRHRVEGLVGIARNGATLFVECGLPDGETKGMLDVDEGLAVAEGDWVVLVVCVANICWVRVRRRISRGLFSVTGAASNDTAVVVVVLVLVCLTQKVVAVAETARGDMGATDAGAARCLAHGMN